MKIVCIKNTVGYTHSHKKILFEEGVLYWCNTNCKIQQFNRYNYTLYNCMSYGSLVGYIMVEDISNFVLESLYRKEIKELDELFDIALYGYNM